jgi:hypothetical protein
MSQTQPRLIAERTFTAHITSETSFGGTNLGEHESTMTLYLAKDATGYIEWDIPGTGDFVSIGLWFEVVPSETGFKLVLTDYDGVFALPTQAIDLLTDNNIEVSDDFR